MSLFSPEKENAMRKLTLDDIAQQDERDDLSVGERRRAWLDIEEEYEQASHTRAGGGFIVTGPKGVGKSITATLLSPSITDDWALRSITAGVSRSARW